MNIFDLSLISYVISFKNSNLAGLSENISILDNFRFWIEPFPRRSSCEVRIYSKIWLIDEAEKWSITREIT